MEKKGTKKYNKGDQIHFIVTEEFIETANEFVTYCKTNSINASEAMRVAIGDWLSLKMLKEKKLQQLIHGTSSLQSIAEEYERDVLKEL